MNSNLIFYALYHISCTHLCPPVGFAMGIPHLDLLIALIGALASASLAMILSALIHTMFHLIALWSTNTQIYFKSIKVFFMNYTPQNVTVMFYTRSVAKSITIYSLTLKGL